MNKLHNLFSDLVIGPTLTVYSISVIYVMICNLSYDIRFKHKNLLTLGLLPKLSKVSLYKINYYLALIVDELEFLWDRITLNHIYKYPREKNIYAVLILIDVIICKV